MPNQRVTTYQRRAWIAGLHRYRLEFLGSTEPGYARRELPFRAVEERDLGAPDSKDAPAGAMNRRPVDRLAELEPYFGETSVALNRATPSPQPTDGTTRASGSCAGIQSTPRLNIVQFKSTRCSSQAFALDV